MTIRKLLWKCISEISQKAALTVYTIFSKVSSAVDHLISFSASQNLLVLSSVKSTTTFTTALKQELFLIDIRYPDTDHMLITRWKWDLNYQQLGMYVTPVRAVSHWDRLLWSYVGLETDDGWMLFSWHLWEGSPQVHIRHHGPLARV